jgi:hypothetical protein
MNATPRKAFWVTMSISFPPRIQSLRDDIVTLLPRVPNDRYSLATLQALPTHALISAFITWRMRFIPTKPRTVKIWPGGVTPMQFRIAAPKLRPLLNKVEAGKDLTSHLSEQVRTKGVVLDGKRGKYGRQDIDMVLTREGLHHFHVGVSSAGNPKGRSGSLVFAEVLDKEFRIVAISDHQAFQRGSPEQLRFFHICHAYMAKDVPPGQGFMPNPVMSSGHSMLVTMFGVKCDDEMKRLDPLLEDPEFIDKLYQGQSVVRPAKPALAWHFEDLMFGVLERQTTVFFCIFPFFAR